MANSFPISPLSLSPPQPPPPLSPSPSLSLPAPLTDSLVTTRDDPSSSHLSYFSSSSSSSSSNNDDNLEDNLEAVLTPPFGLRMNGAEKPYLDVLSRLMDLLRSVRPGSHLANFQVPVQFNMEKSQLQVYGESVYCYAQDLLGRCAQGGTPMERFLHVVAWHISTTRHAPFGKSPFNPILGETHHVSNGDLNVFLEQVSHHPPITALYASNKVKGIKIQWWHTSEPRFHGSSLEVTIYGRRVLELSSHQEIYEMNCPKLLICLFPNPGMEWVGKVRVHCPQSNLEANILFKRKIFFGLGRGENRVEGKICDTTSHKTLYQIVGRWDGVISIKDVGTGKSTILYDAHDSIVVLASPIVEDHSNLLPTESAVVWSTVIKGILEKDWNKAREAKNIVEEMQRTKRRDKGGREWHPIWFVKRENGDWEWKQTNMDIPKAPIVVPSPLSTP